MNPALCPVLQKWDGVVKLGFLVFAAIFLCAVALVSMGSRECSCSCW